MSVQCPRCQSPSGSNARCCQNCGYPLGGAQAQDRTAVMSQVGNGSPFDLSATVAAAQAAVGPDFTSQSLVSPTQILQCEHTVCMMDVSTSMGGKTHIEA